MSRRIARAAIAAAFLGVLTVTTGVEVAVETPLTPEEESLVQRIRAKQKAASKKQRLLQTEHFAR